MMILNPSRFNWGWTPLEIPIFLHRTCRPTFTTSGVARTFGAHGQRTLRGPSPYFLWPLPHIHPFSDFAHVYLYYVILNTALLISTYIMVQFENLGPFDDAMGEIGVPLWRNDKWDSLKTWWEIRGHRGGPRVGDAMMNWDGPLTTWWEIRGHHFDDMMK